jgi:hypothetical protein
LAASHNEGDAAPLPSGRLGVISHLASLKRSTREVSAKICDDGSHGDESREELCVRLMAKKIATAVPEFGDGGPPASPFRPVPKRGPCTTVL